MGRYATARRARTAGPGALPDQSRTDGGPRAALAAAIRDRNTAKRARDKTAEAVERAQQLKRDREAALSTYGTVDADVTALQVGMMKTGGTMSLDLPPKLITRLRDRDQAKADLASALSVHTALVKELEGLEHDLADWEGTVKRNAAAVLAEEAERIANDLMVAKRTMWSLSDQLGGLAALYFPQDGRAAPPPISKRALDALDVTPPLKVMGAGPTSEQQMWRKYFDQLCVDADARFAAVAV